VHGALTGNSIFAVSSNKSFYWQKDIYMKQDHMVAYFYTHNNFICVGKSNNMRKIILASGSKRRIDFFKHLFGENFEVHPSNYKEDYKLKMQPKSLAMHHALMKAKHVAKNYNGGLVIGADTFVLLGNTILGKPKNKTDARKMLKMQSGKTIKVISGLALVDIDNNKHYQDFEITKVKFARMTQKEINNYVKTGEPLGKAGAFAIQEKGAKFIEKIDGCFSNVIGLPLCKLYKLLKKIGVFHY